MNAALETLFFALENGSEVNGATLVGSGTTVFINSSYHSVLEEADREKLYLYQPFAPYARELLSHGFSVREYGAVMPEGTADLVLVLVPKNMIEARYNLAQGLSFLRDGGMLVCAAENKAGGTRFKSLLEGFGVSQRQSVSRNKARAICAFKGSGVDEVAIQKALCAGAVQPILEERFLSQPGVFGWNKIDAGSKILVDTLPVDIRGRVADFGCGYGYLSAEVLDISSGIKALYCLDADKRALDVCALNLRHHKNKPVEIDYLWCDITDFGSALKDLDYVIMNPPFHEGRFTKSAIGVAFIEQACKSLRRGGTLWMVANAHLPYERVLGASFQHVEKVSEGQGFKVYKAVK